MRTVNVDLGARSYQIQVRRGLLYELGQRARTALGPNSRQAVLVSNDTIGPVYSSDAVRSLSLAGFKVHQISIGDGERFKSLRTAQALYSFLIERRIERGDVIVALGGGIVGDLAGFVAATYLRGIRLIQVPTTLLAQIDSSVGGKTGVNHPLGKNLIGAFHQPSLVIIDPDVLQTLPERQLRAGLYEAIKYGVICDRTFFEHISSNLDQLKNLDPRQIEYVIARCCAIKAWVVESDEHETDLRRILNFGHTVGHALEAVTQYRRFLHGEAVGLGMLAASRIAERMGLLETGERLSLVQAVGAVGRLPRANTLALDGILAAMHHDKKVEAGRASFVLPVEIGRVVIRSDVSPRVIKAALKDVLT